MSLFLFSGESPCECPRGSPIGNPISFPCEWEWPRSWFSSSLSKSTNLTFLGTCNPLTTNYLKFSLKVSISLLLFSKHMSSCSLDESLGKSKLSPISDSCDFSESSLMTMVLSFWNLSKALCYFPLKNLSIPYVSLTFESNAKMSTSSENLSLHLFRSFYLSTKPLREQGIRQFSIGSSNTSEVEKFIFVNIVFRTLSCSFWATLLSLDSLYCFLLISFDDFFWT